jgi:hypothetical protein
VVEGVGEDKASVRARRIHQLRLATDGFGRSRAHLSGAPRELRIRTMGLKNSVTDTSCMGRSCLVVVSAWLTLGASAAVAQEEPEPAPEPFIPQSQFEQPGPENSLDQQMRSCQETLGYNGCDELWHGKRGQGGAGVPAIWGALAVSTSTTNFGYSYDYPSSEAANAAALQSCNSIMKGKRDCKVRSTFSRNCIALATSDDGASGYSRTYGDLVADDREALSYCQNSGGKSCTTVLAYCSPNGGFHTWVGLAISMEPQPKAGISWGAVAQSTASRLALDYCIKEGGSKCKVRMLLYNQCVAFAKSPNGMWGAFNNMNRKVAETNSIRKCLESHGTNCAVALSACSNDPIK